MNVVVVDDERIARSKLSTILRTLPEVGRVTESADGAAAVKRIGSDRPDLVSLDVHLPELTRFEIIRASGPEQMPVVVFVTCREHVDRFAFRLNGRTIVVNQDQIDLIEAADNYVRVHIGQRHHTVRGKISTLEARLDPCRFARVHRSAIVNLDRVLEIRCIDPGEVAVLHDGKMIPIGATRRDTFLRRLGVDPR